MGESNDAGLEVITELTDHNTRKISYLFEGDQCLHVEMKSLLALQLARFEVLHKELDFCLHLMIDATDRMLALTPKDLSRNYKNNNTENLRIRSAFTAAVVTYGKLFGGGKGRRKLDKEAVFPNDGSGLADFHDWIIKLRHKYIAHATDEHDYEICRVIHLKRPLNIESDWLYVQAHVQFMVTPDLETMISFLGLVEYVDTAVKNASQAIVERVLEEAKSTDWSNYYENAVIATEYPLHSKGPTVDIERVQPSKLK